MPTSYKFLGMTDGPQTIVRAVLKSWTHPLDADPGPALIELNLGTAEERTDMCAEITPARPVPSPRRCLIAATAERDGHGNRTEADRRALPSGRTRPPFAVGRALITLSRKEAAPWPGG